MANQGQNGNGDRWGPTASVTQADRSMWQRQAAETLVCIACWHRDLPAIHWSVTRNGGLTGQVTGQPSPTATAKAFGWWHKTLGLGNYRHVAAGTIGFAHVRAQGNFGLVRVTLAATVAVTQGARAAWWRWPGTAGAIGHRAEDAIPGACRLARILDIHQNLDAIAWTIRSSGELHGRIGHRPGNGAGEAFRLWQQALRLENGETVLDGTVTRHVGFATQDDVSVELRATSYTTPSRLARHRAVRPGEPGAEIRSDERPVRARPGGRPEPVRDPPAAALGSMPRHGRRPPSAWSPGPVQSP